MPSLLYIAFEINSMPTIATEDGYFLKIYPNDHTPAHVHVQKAENEARVRLDNFEIVSNEGFNSRELGRIRALVEKYQELLFSAWDLYHQNR